MLVCVSTHAMGLRETVRKVRFYSLNIPGPIVSIKHQVAAVVTWPTHPTHDPANAGTAERHDVLVCRRADRSRYGPGRSGADRLATVGAASGMGRRRP